MNSTALISAQKTTGDGGCKAQGETPGFFLLALILFLFSTVNSGQSQAGPRPQSELQNQTHIKDQLVTPSRDSQSNWSNFLPYTPPKKDYEIELGGMWEMNDLYWLGGSFGYNVGNCIFVSKIGCHQYIDATGGVGGRMGYTEGLVLGGLRWQFLVPSKSYSPSTEVFAGAMDIRDNVRAHQVLTYGIAFGLTASLHPKFDLKWENRLGMAHRFWAQSFVSISLRLDRVVDYVSNQVKGASKTFVDWFNEPLDSREK